ncbi:hypothetical protein RAC92_15240 [Agrobacterium sp. CR_3]|uniref:hypothetical protein n=1 Tax=unclassified Agrobacterium TaxID=2632611 RepID=UPI0035C20C78
MTHKRAAKIFCDVIDEQSQAASFQSEVIFVPVALIYRYRVNDRDLGRMMAHLYLKRQDIGLPL